jgi:SAM-dependent methyltransferase
MSETGVELGLELTMQVRGLISNALKKRYTSTSSHMDYKTGNAYQSIDLGEEVISGYRRDRSDLFKAFNLVGRRVLDCGCNLGELSRLARRNGAALVDGVEYDNYFVQIAQMINAYHGMTRVSISQGDLTKAEAFSDTYDVSMAFSVFPYITPTLWKLAEVTREAFILETHNVTSDLRKVYVEPVSRYFPYHSFVAYSDFGHGEGKRAVIVFAKEARTLGPDGFLSSTVDLRDSTFGFTEPMMEVVRKIAPGERRTRDDMERVVAQLCDLPNDLSKLTAGRTYWLAMMKGYLQARAQGKVTAENEYVKTLRVALTVQNFDPLLAKNLASEDALLARVKRRFDAIDRFHDGVQEIEPITIFGINENAGRFKIKNGTLNSTVWSDNLDGYHRIFWGTFFNVGKIPAVFQIA